ncbi:MAG: hypothetical protein QW272_10205 [Candidatus Methanomethylicaceae archaeon]
MIEIALIPLLLISQIPSNITIFYKYNYPYQFSYLDLEFLICYNSNFSMPVKNATINIKILETNEEIILKTNDYGYSKISYFLILNKYTFLIKATDGNFTENKEIEVKTSPMLIPAYAITFLTFASTLSMYKRKNWKEVKMKRFHY